MTFAERQTKLIKRIDSSAAHLLKRAETVLKYPKRTRNLSLQQQVYLNSSYVSNTKNCQQVYFVFLACKNEIVGQLAATIINPSVQRETFLEGK